MKRQVIGKAANGYTLFIEWYQLPEELPERSNHKSHEGEWFWQTLRDPMRGAFGGVGMVDYYGYANSEHEAIDAAKATAIEDPKGYINLK